jgi:hypothetical protein
MSRDFAVRITAMQKKSTKTVPHSPPVPEDGVTGRNGTDAHKMLYSKFKQQYIGTTPKFHK